MSVCLGIYLYVISFQRGFEVADLEIDWICGASEKEDNGIRWICVEKWISLLSLGEWKVEMPLEA